MPDEQSLREQLTTIKTAQRALMIRVDAIERNIGGHVQDALSTAVSNIEEAAERVTTSTRMRAVVMLAGAFFGSASVAIFVEIIKRM